MLADTGYGSGLYNVVLLLHILAAIVGFGGAQKLAVAKMVQRMLGLDELPDPDAADALAVAITHAQHRSSRELAARVAR